MKVLYELVIQYFEYFQGKHCNEDEWWHTKFPDLEGL